jgi:hypothetical protein
MIIFKREKTREMRDSTSPEIDEWAYYFREIIQERR